MLRKRSLTVAAVAALASSSLLPPSQGADASTADPSVPSVLTGRALAANGTPSSGAQVLLYAWPRNASLDALPDSAPVDMPVITRATTDETGRYRLTLPSASALAPYTASNGAVNLEVVTHDGADSAAVSATRQVRAPQTGVDPVSDTWRGATSVRPLHLFPADRRVAGPTFTSRTMNAMADSCSTFKVKDYGPRWALVGAAYSNVDGVTTSFGYTKGASSQLGVAASASGKYGSFSASGTNSVSSSGAVDFPSLSGAGRRSYYTKFDFAKFKMECVYEGGGVMDRYTYRATKWIGGAKVGTPGSTPTATKCVYYAAGSGFTKSNTHAVTWSKGAQVGGDIGMSLSSQTGYESDAQVHFGFHRGRHLCGKSDYPGGSPKILVVKK